MTTEDTIDLDGLDLAAVLAALYNDARPQGMGYLHFTPEDMPVDRAREILRLAGEYPYFDYLGGRVMKVDLSKKGLDPAMYDRDNGEGAAARALAPLRESAAA